MKGKLKTNSTTQNGELIPNGTKVEIINGWCGCDGYEYQCVLPDKRMFVISYSAVEITDDSPYVNWEQRRYEIARDAMCAYIASYSGNFFQSTPSSVVGNAILYADELIKQLKGE